MSRPRCRTSQIPLYHPAYTPPRLNFTTVRTLEVRQKFNHTFDNLRVIVYTNGAWAAVPVSDLSNFMGYGVETLVEESVLASGSPYNPALGAAVITNVTQVPIPPTRWLGSISS